MNVKPQAPSRRELLAILGGAGALSAAEVCLPAASPQTQGPYWVDENLNRSDIRPDPVDGTVAPGLPLNLAIQFHDVRGIGCKPLKDAKIDIWQCDAVGKYSNARDNGTSGKKFLRGFQMADADGGVRFLTVYPGWYHGRTVHIHFHVRRTLENGTLEQFTSQLYFPDDLSDQVFQQEPYAGRRGRDTKNGNDMILHGGERDGAVLYPAMKTLAGKSYQGTLAVGIDFSKQADDRFGGPRGAR